MKPSISTKSSECFMPKIFCLSPRRSLLLVVLASFSFILLPFPDFTFADETKTDDKNEIRIGAIASLTGHAAEQGKNWSNGARLAAEELQSRGIPLKFILEDDNTNPSRAVSALRKMIDFDHIHVGMGGTWDFLLEAVVPIVKSSKIPFLTMTNPVEILSEAASSNPYLFTNALSLKATESAMRRFFEIKKPKSIAILAPSFPFTNAHAALAKKLAHELAIPVVFDTAFSYDDYFQSLKVLATKTIQSKPDLVCIFVSAQSLDPFLLALKQQRSAPAVLTTQHLDAAFAATTDRTAYGNAYGLYPKIVDPDFTRRYRIRFKDNPRVYAAEGYDALRFAVFAFQRNIKIGESSEEFHYRGATGDYQLPTQGRQLGNISAAIMTTRSGRFEEALEFTASPSAPPAAAPEASAASTEATTESTADIQAPE